MFSGTRKGNETPRPGLRNSAAAGRRIAVLSLSLLLFGCALSEGYDSQDYSVARATRIFSTGYQGVSDVYINDLALPQLALAGLGGLTAIEPELAVDIRDRQLVVSVRGQQVHYIKAPDDDDPRDWGNLTATAIELGQRNSAALARATPEALYEAVFDGIVEELDSFSRYAGRDQARENKASREGFGGLGIRIGIVDHGVKVVSVIEGTPAETAGLKAEDVITAIDGEPAAGMSQREAIRRLRGRIRSLVELTVNRGSVPDPLTISVTRAHIVPQTVIYKAEGQVGYIQVTSFNQRTTNNLREKVLQAERELGKDLKGLVLDLRANPGGLLEQAVSVSDLFVTDGRIVSTHGRHPDSHQYFDAQKNDLADGLPLVVLVNGNSASAAEIVAAALQDRGRALIIGSNSFGKGTVQNVRPLPNEGELILTWARFHAPSGYALHERGVLPNICTSALDGSVGSVLDSIRQGKAVIEQAAYRVSIESKDEAGIEALRNRCPVDERIRELDLKVAVALIRDHMLYAEVLNSASNTAARPES